MYKHVPWKLKRYGSSDALTDTRKADIGMTYGNETPFSRTAVRRHVNFSGIQQIIKVTMTSNAARVTFFPLFIPL